MFRNGSMNYWFIAIANVFGVNNLIMVDLGIEHYTSALKVNKSTISTYISCPQHTSVTQPSRNII